VLDVDPRHGGWDGLEYIENEHGKMPHTITANTGGAGRHYYFSHAGGYLPNTTNKIAQGLDSRGDGGYVVAAPSNHISGSVYEWDADFKPSKTELAPMPEWFIEVERREAQPVEVLERARLAPPVPERIPDGLRNATLASLAGTMRRRGMGTDAIFAALMEENNAKCEPPLSADEVMKIAISYSRYIPAAPVLAQVEEEIQKLHAREPMDAYGAGVAFMELVTNIKGRLIRTGIPPIDRFLVGMERQTLTILAARPSMGKSTLAWQIARNVAERGQKVLFLSLEMSAPALWAKAACGAAGLRWMKFLAEEATEWDVKMVLDKTSELMEAYGENLLIDDGMHTTATIAKMVETHRPDLLVIDHLRYIADAGDNENKRLGLICTRLTDIAKGHNCSVICLAQLNRGVEQGSAGSDKRPSLKDLRDSGEIEEAADNVWMLYRKDYYDAESKGNANSETELLARKFRMDLRNQRVMMIFDTVHQQFLDSVTVDLTDIGFGGKPK
jgi:replicative DNA helicase